MIRANTIREGTPLLRLQANRVGFRKSILHFNKHALAYLSPRNRFTSRLLNLYWFRIRNGRLPRGKRNSLNDYLYQRKVGGDLNHWLVKKTSDKMGTKEIVEQVLGPDFAVPTLEVLGTPHEICNYKFASGTVIKPTHLSGKVKMLLTSHDVAKIDREDLIHWLQMDYFRISREENYRDLPRKVIIEPLAMPIAKNQNSLTDYKIFCLDGKARLVQIDEGRFGEHKRTLFDSKGQMLSAGLHYPPPGQGAKLPKNFDVLISLAERIASLFEFVRVDMFTDGSKVKIGELTHCPGGAGERIIPSSAEAEVTSLFWPNKRR